MIASRPEEGRNADDWHDIEERTPRILLSLHKGLVGEMDYAHTEAASLVDDDAHSPKYLLDTLKGHFDQE